MSFGEILFNNYCPFAGELVKKEFIIEKLDEITDQLYLDSIASSQVEGYLVIPETLYYVNTKYMYYLLKPRYPSVVDDIDDDVVIELSRRLIRDELENHLVSPLVNIVFQYSTLSISELFN
jgi:hypothetical protein